MSFANHVVEFCRVIASSIGATNGAPLFNVAGIAGFAVNEEGAITGEDPSDAGAEQAHEQEVYQSLGVIGRPLPPEGDAFAEALTLRTEDGLLPFAFRDVRLHRALNPSGTPTTPREGQLMFAGYGGAFLSHSMTAGNTGSKRGNISVLYVPYQFSPDGVPERAHAVILDASSGNESVSIVHGSGLSLTMTDSGIVASADASTFLSISPGKVSISAESVLLKGNVYLGRVAEAGVPLLAGIASPPSQSVFISTL